MYGRGQPENIPEREPVRPTTHFPSRVVFPADDALRREGAEALAARIEEILNAAQLPDYGKIWRIHNLLKEYRQ